MTESEVSKNLLADFYKQHFDEIMAFVSRRLDHSAESEDLVQNIFLRLMESDRMITQVTLPCLIYTIARNMISDYWRHRTAVNAYEHYIKMSDGASANTGDRSVYSISELHEILERGIAHLSVKQQHIYRMNVLYGMQVSEISERLNENYKSVENRLGAARKVMRNYVKRMLA